MIRSQLRYYLLDWRYMDVERRIYEIEGKGERMTNNYTRLLALCPEQLPQVFSSTKSRIRGFTCIRVPRVLCRSRHSPSVVERALTCEFANSAARFHTQQKTHGKNGGDVYIFIGPHLYLSHSTEANSVLSIGLQLISTEFTTPVLTSRQRMLPATDA